jgi:hypothetical protein
MTDEQRIAQLEAQLARVEGQQQRSAIDRGYIRSRLDPKQKGGGTGSLEFVAFTAHTGTGGDENTLANFTYTFTDSLGITHPNIAPAQQRPKGTLLFGTHGTYDRLNNVLKDVDEVPDTGVCSASLAAVTGETPFFGF